MDIFEDESPLFNEELERIDAAVEAALALAQDNQVFTDAWLADALDLGAPPELVADWKLWELLRVYRTKFWERELLDVHGVLLTNVPGVGHRVVPPEEREHFMTYAVNRRARKAIREALKVLTHAAVDELTPSELAEREEAIARYSKLEHELATGDVDVERLMEMWHEVGHDFLE